MVEGDGPVSDAELVRLDHHIDRCAGQGQSLDPARRRATPLATLVPDLTRDIDGQEHRELARALHEGAAQIAAAQLKNFPENLFWDFDGLLGTLLAAALKHDHPSVELRTRCTLIAQLQHVFGAHTTIRFRYVHDFLYGFDWARWVARAPEKRAHVGPFDPEFLSYCLKRGAELQELIEQNDQKYPALPTGNFRNPFAFSRSPEHEGQLMRDLAARSWIPAPGWTKAMAPQWNRPYATMRERRARSLGIGQPAA